MVYQLLLVFVKVELLPGSFRLVVHCFEHEGQCAEVVAQA